MGELHFTIRWPDGSLERCYSPSRSVKAYFTPGESYPLTDFVHRSTSALELASERVRRRHGFMCTSAAEQLAAIERTAAGFDAGTGARVTVVGFEE
ncbi:MSMEG_0570 family nitrogen starvation response protein [soil metagenome]